MKIACIQVDVHFGNPDKNYENIENKIRDAVSKQNVDTIILPELWDTAYDLSRLNEISDSNGERAKSLLSKLSKEFAVNIIGGSIACREGNGIYNTSLSFNRKGEHIGTYSKAHLITLMEEEKYISSGKNSSMFKIDGILSTAAICYDIRFPEWIRAPFLKGAKILFVPAQWPIQRQTHWRALLMARAIENQCYVIACNRVGQDPNNTFAGQSMIVDPWGDIIAQGSSGDEEILFADISPELVEEVRAKVPVFNDRRTDLY
ncbi:carbon-nitrogen family hydrolase [Fictibacillus barbaricus]|uniref:Carbon-nitrogen family hydrolase n=1 Tax=Fictibacillus barbaricus TaxID=182136 RepID=A0ABS2ZB32_9BACL|nr:carbon-nitrogen family hydrolase [Fictibacillus barbaricus]MBN3545425.1 carbon-nitrogen family hydrolase [Fictibacillus barbaricus]GGB59118.1 hydrolase [Fictibacillus barbaricus]